MSATWSKRDEEMSDDEWETFRQLSTTNILGSLNPYILRGGLRIEVPSFYLLRNWSAERKGAFAKTHSVLSLSFKVEKPLWEVIKDS